MSYLKWNDLKIEYYKNNNPEPLKMLNKKRINFYEKFLNDFNCSNMTGSKNITSDYDITFFISEKELDIFDEILSVLYQLDNNNFSLSIMFDMNLYFYEISSPKFKNNYLSDIFYSQKVSSLNCNNNNILFTITNKYFYDIQMFFLGLKILDYNILNKINYDFNPVRDLLVLVGKKGNSEYENYLKQINLVKKLHHKLEEIKIKKTKKNTENFVYINCLSRYYANEGYFTYSTMNVIVYEKILKIKLKLNDYDYKISIIENYFDLYKKINKNTDLVKLVENSKNIDRIYYSISKLSHEKYKSIKPNNDLLKKIKSVVDLRKDMKNLEKNKDIIYYIYNLDTEKFNFKTFENIMINNINLLIK